MLRWQPKHPRATFAMLGLIPNMISEADPRPAREQIDANYKHGGGWSSFKGFKMLANGNIQYPGDPPRRLLYEAELRGEIIRFYENAWMAIIQPSGEIDIAKID